MKKARFLLSLTNDDNDYQVEQASAAKQTAIKRGIELEIIHARNDGIVQSQQLLNRIQSSTNPRPDAILFEPAGSTTLPQVARAAVAAGIGWVVLNRDADYIADLRRQFQVPVFALTSDHEEVGRIQGRQLSALAPGGGMVLYVQGPSESSAAKQRLFGTLETKLETVQLRVLKAHWTEASAYKAVSSWLRLSTSRDNQMVAVCAQDDSMAVGARKAFEECFAKQPELWQKIPFLGCDGLPKTGQEWVRRGTLAATVFIPPNAGDAMELMMKSIESGTQPPDRTFTPSKSIPEIDALQQQALRARASGR
ncbi:MAG: sugar ABC transporter substrate-binding protein [Acidobacteria bacterium]|nr:sugar ABC transporter substrate-binding protein [Acidobacteriota bacterium]